MRALVADCGDAFMGCSTSGWCTVEERRKKRKRRGEGGKEKGGHPQ